MSKLKYGIIGTGNIAVSKHLTGYAALKDEVELMAVCDNNKEAAERAAKQFGIPNVFTDYRNLLAMKDIDLISVCTPNCLHAPVTIEALEAGKHVHCEKPMAMNSEEAQEMLDTARKTGRKLMVGLNNRFTKETQFVKKYVDDGNLGEIYYIKCGWVRRSEIAPRGWFTDKALSGGGSLIDLGVHFIDLAMYFMNYPQPKSVVARTFCKFGNTGLCKLYTLEGIPTDVNKKFDVEDFAAGFIDLNNDACITFEISWALNTENERTFYELNGTKGGLCFNKSGLKIFTLVNGQQADIQPHINGDFFGANEFRYFIECIRTGEEPVISPPEQGVAMMKLIDGIYRSAEERKQIEFH
ncbi:MAG: Gfo/Idh/MocA family oxidoreductase [Clostridiales bacterium]|nr:Gfo/Idh/MocA family oxidoreductase [Clostridiales bacterium]